MWIHCNFFKGRKQPHVHVALMHQLINFKESCIERLSNEMFQTLTLNPRVAHWALEHWYMTLQPK